MFKNSINPEVVKSEYRPEYGIRMSDEALAVAEDVLKFDVETASQKECLELTKRADDADVYQPYYFNGGMMSDKLEAVSEVRSALAERLQNDVTVTLHQEFAKLLHASVKTTAEQSGLSAADQADTVTDAIMAVFSNEKTNHWLPEYVEDGKTEFSLGGSVMMENVQTNYSGVTNGELNRTPVRTIVKTRQYARSDIPKERVVTSASLRAAGIIS